MKILVQAFQAVTVEFFGVLLVVGMLYGFGSVGLKTAGIGQENDAVRVARMQPSRALAHRATQDHPRFTAEPVGFLSLVTHNR